MKIKCKTIFDCTRTGITGHFRSSQVPFVDRSGQLIENQQHWSRSRNQQRNYETLLQIFGLKTQPQDITAPVRHDNKWEFEFAVESSAVFKIANDPDVLAGLKNDCQGVPMVIDVSDASQKMIMLSAAGLDQNIWFEVINTATEN